MAVIDLQVVTGGVEQLRRHTVQQGRLITLERQDIVTITPADISGGVTLSMSSIPGDNRPIQVNALQQRPDLDDLVRGLRNTDLGNDHGLLVQHRREQLHVALGITGAGVTHDLAVHRDTAPLLGQRITLGVVGCLGTLGDPLADQQVRGFGVNVFHHPTQRGTARRDQFTAALVAAGTSGLQQKGRQIGSPVACLTEVAGPRPAPRRP
jgi:hypothetical protein